jgi:hypothetical protein
MEVKKRLNIPVTAIVLVVFIGVVIGIGFWGSKKAEPVKGDVSSTGPVSLEDELQKEGKVFYISPDGDDLNPGTRQSPLKTVNAAVGKAADGDTIIVKPISTGKTSQIRGEVFYVSPDGDDSNPGTQQSPLRTINAAVRTAKDGDTIVIKPKAYSDKAPKARPT